MYMAKKRRLYFVCLELKQISITVYCHTYPTLITYCKISSVGNKDFRCDFLAFSNCNMQRSPLMEGMKQLKKIVDYNSQHDSKIDCMTSQCISTIAISDGGSHSLQILL